MSHTRRPVLAGVAVAAAVAAAWLLFFALPRWYAQPTPAAPPVEKPTAPAEARKIKATLYYVSTDGLRLVGIEQDVPYGEGAAEQARRIMEAQIGEPPAPYVTAFPQGTALRAVFVTGRGDAFVDFSREISANHMGGSLAELFTVYTVVNALTTNLPAITGVQILVDGQEVDTLAGHIDLRHPLRKSVQWVQAPGAAPGT